MVSPERSGSKSTADDGVDLQRRGDRGALGSRARNQVLDIMRARHQGIRIVTREEDHALSLMVEAAIELGKPVLTWSTVGGIREGLFDREARLLTPVLPVERRVVEPVAAVPVAPDHARPSLG